MNRLKSFFTLDRVLLVIVAVVLYGNTLTNGYSLDDGYVTQKENVTAKGLSAIPGLFTSFYGVGKNGLQYDYRPVVKVSFAIEHQFFGVKPATSHFFNLVLYIIGLFLVYNFIALLLHPARNKIPLYVALLFALLPIHTEVVASIKNRDILLCFIFILQCCLLILRAQTPGQPVVGKYLLATLCAFLAFLSKLDALPYVVILPTIILVKFKPRLGKIALYGGIILAGIVLERILFRVATGGQEQLRPHFYFENPLFIHSGPGQKIVALFNSLGFYLVQCIFPFKQSCYYGADTIPVTEMHLYGYVGVLTAAALVWLLIYGWKKDHDLLIGVAIFAASISMYLNIGKPVVGIVADRFTFFASLGFCMAIVFGLRYRFQLDKKLSPPLRNVAILLFIVYGYMAISRNGEWKSVETVLESDVKKYPSSAYLNYLDATGKLRMAERRDLHLPRLQRQNLVFEAKKELERSVAVATDYPGSLQLLAHILIFYQKDHQGALPYVNQALHLKTNSELLFYKGLCLESLKNDSSEYYLKEAIKMDSAAFNAYGVLAEHYNANGEFDKTLDLLTSAVHKGLSNEMIYSGLAATYFLKKDTVNAKLYCEKVLALDPNNKRARQILLQLK